MKWLDANGFHIQDIIDNELNDIKSLYKDEGPKVHFISFNGKGTDADVSDHIFLALEYDAKVSSVHNEEKYGNPISINGK
jgi:hypothetical protein